MTHPEDLLADYVRGSVSPSELATVEAHLSTCSHCAAEVELARAARASLQGLPEVPAPSNVASQALEAAGRAGNDGRPRYRWLGAAAAAAVVALAVVTLQHRGPEASRDAGVAAAIGGAATSPTAGSSLHLIVEQKNYNETTLNSLARAALSNAGSPAGATPPEDATAAASQGAKLGSATEIQTALTCVGNAVPHDDQATPFRLLQAQFNGKPAYLAFYYRGPQGAPPTSVVVWIVDSATCAVSGLSSAGT
jgi:putative zinc finger protein